MLVRLCFGFHCCPITVIISTVCVFCSYRHRVAPTRTPTLFSLSLKKKIHTIYTHFGFLCGFLSVEVHERVKMAHHSLQNPGTLGFKSSFIKFCHIPSFV